MSRPTEADLTVPGPRWREIPMPAANAPFAMTRLDAVEPELAMYGRFPPGFDRAAAGGYDVAEEFLVLEGELVVDGRCYRRGDLTFVPPRYVRGGMSTAAGATVLAWFGGPAHFVAEGELAGEHREGLRSVSVLEAPPGPLLDTGRVRWSLLGPGAGEYAGADHPVDLVDGGLGRWRRGSGRLDVRAPAVLRERT